MSAAASALNTCFVAYLAGKHCAVCRHLRKYLNEDIVKELVGDAHAIAELEKEWDQLTEDRLALRQIFPSGESKVNAAI